MIDFPATESQCFCLKRSEKLARLFMEQLPALPPPLSFPSVSSRWAIVFFCQLFSSQETLTSSHRIPPDRNTGCLMQKYLPVLFATGFPKPDFSTLPSSFQTNWKHSSTWPASTKSSSLPTGSGSFSDSKVYDLDDFIFKSHCILFSHSVGEVCAPLAVQPGQFNVLGGWHQIWSWN